MTETTGNHAEVRRVVDLIDNLVDAKDWAGCRDLFADTVAVDFGALGGPPARMSADELVTGWRTNLYADKASFHMRTNHDIDVSGDTATVRSKGYALNILSRALGDGLWEVWGNYVHHLVRVRGQWRCDGMRVSVVHARGNETVRTYVPAD
ncbi:MAG TPA: nuclear transport factor 2 family protein [Pilimelia sp.]|nr:nuclear transport factor 2 family protein [Pilimelia sp.]